MPYYPPDSAYATLALLDKCEQYMGDRQKENEFKKMVELFDLSVPMNRCSIIRKQPKQVEDDYLRWKKVAKAAERFHEKNV